MLSIKIVAGLRRALLRSFVALLAGIALFAGISPAIAGAYDDYFRAVKFNDAGTVNALLKRGLDPNTIEAERGDSGLILALREDSMKVFDELIKTPGVNLEIKAVNGDTALMIAAYKGNRPAVQTLLAKGAKPNRPGWTALHYAAAAGHTEIAHLLLGKAANIDAKAPNKTTPIMMAARGGHISTVKLLLDAGADATLKNELGMTALDFASKGNHRDIAEGITSRLKRDGKP